MGITSVTKPDEGPSASIVSKPGGLHRLLGISIGASAFLFAILLFGFAMNPGDTVYLQAETLPIALFSIELLAILVSRRTQVIAIDREGVSVSVRERVTKRLPWDSIVKVQWGGWTRISPLGKRRTSPYIDFFCVPNRKSIRVLGGFRNIDSPEIRRAAEVSAELAAPRRIPVENKDVAF